MARIHSQRGVTLIELLVVITLVAAISTGLLMAMRIALNTMEKTQVRLEENGALRYASAGHLPPRLRRGNCCIRTVESRVGRLTTRAEKSVTVM